MQLMRLNCPNCNGPLKMIKEGTFYCENCDSAYMADYDKDDVEIQKMKLENELRKQQLGREQSKSEERSRKAKEQFRIKLIVIAIVSVIALIIVVPTVIVTLKSQKEAAEKYRQEQIDREARQEAEKAEQEEKRRQEEEAKAAADEAERQAKLATYRLSTDEIISDEFFVENANLAIEGQLPDNTNLFWTNWTWGEDPEYITSYFLVAKDENNKRQNMLLSIYKISWDKVYEDHTDSYVMYDGACLYNISRNEDGTIKSDYAPGEMSYHDEMISNQFLSGYSDFDDLIRQEIYGNADYDYVEFSMPGHEN